MGQMCSKNLNEPDVYKPMLSEKQKKKIMENLKQDMWQAPSLQKRIINQNHTKNSKASSASSSFRMINNCSQDNVRLYLRQKQRQQQLIRKKQEKQREQHRKKQRIRKIRNKIENNEELTNSQKGQQAQIREKIRCQKQQKQRKEIQRKKREQRQSRFRRQQQQRNKRWKQQSARNMAAQNNVWWWQNQNQRNHWTQTENYYNQTYLQQQFNFNNQMSSLR